MAIELPDDVNQEWPLFRILTRETFGAGTGAADDQRVSGGGWETRPMRRRGLNGNGFEVLNFERVALPMIGRATILYRYGTFDGIPPGNGSNEEWDPATDSLSLPDLTGYEVRIQVAEKPDDETAAATGWRTVYWGTVDTVEDRMMPGATTPHGDRIYHLVDGFYRTSRWALDHHGVSVTAGAFGTITFGHCRGHPGYNVGLSHDAVASGNKSTPASQYQTPAGLQVYFHTAPGAGAKWTDLEVIQHALDSSKPPGEPKFTVMDGAGLLSGTSSWEVREGENVHAFALRVFKRERGKGLAYLDWDDDSGDDDSGDPTGPLTVYMTVDPQIADSITYDDPSTGSTVTINGADTQATTTTVELIGDHRCIAESFAIGDPDQHRVGYLETLGEPIEVLATLAYVDQQFSSGTTIDSRVLLRGWSAEHQAIWRAFTSGAGTLQQRAEARHKPVYQAHQFNPGWNGMLGNGNGAAAHPAGYRCTAAGRIVTPDTATDEEKKDEENTRSTSPLLVEVLEDLPIFDGYKYDNNYTVPTRSDNVAQETGDPQRQKIKAYVRLSSDRYLDVDQTSSGSVGMSVDGRTIWVTDSGDEGQVTRYFSDTALSGSGASYAYSQLVLTVGLRLPHRARMASGNRDAKRRANIYLPNHHLWLASPGAIHDLDGSTGSATAGWAGKREALGATPTTPGILRDDRSPLARVHNLAWAWYGDDTAHRTCTWALKACGFLPNFETEDGSVTYPLLGEVVTTMAACGQTFTLNTPVTRVHYDNESGVTTWSTEWNELNFD